MTVARVAQVEAEAILAPDPKARVSQIAAEVIYSADATARPTQVIAEGIIGTSRGVTMVVS